MQTVTVYIDESGTHDSAPHMIMGGIVGRADQWPEHDRRFVGLLKKNGLTYFHAVELRHRKNEYRSWSDFSAQQLLLGIDRLQNRTTLYRFATLLRKSEYHGHYRSGERPKKIPLDSMYGICFRCSLSLASELSDRAFGSGNYVLNFVLEENQRFGDALRIFHQIKKYLPELAKVLGTCIPGKKKEYAGLQGADAISFSGYRHEVIGDESDLVGFKGLKEARQAVGTGSPVMRVYVRPDILREIKANKFQLEALWRDQSSSKSEAKLEPATLSFPNQGGENSNLVKQLPEKATQQLINSGLEEAPPETVPTM
jgi:Protein of unknown function (DUF3800)